MAERFDIEDRWPELVAPLDGAQRNAVRQSLAAAWHEGWVPNREDVENLTDVASGAIDDEEYLRRVRQAAERQRLVAEAIHSGEMDGLHVSSAGQADAAEYVAGRIDSDELVARARARYGLHQSGG